MDRKTSILFLAFAVFSIFVLLTGHGHAAAGCAPNIGKRVPVELVHGWSSDGSMWTSDGSSSMWNALQKLKNVYVDTPFNYGADDQEWVTNQNIGPALATRISCLAQSSKQSGGLGKVILIGHSMGGLAIREAAEQVVNKQIVGKDIGLVVTIGTPNTGTDISSTATGLLTAICAGHGFGAHVSGNNPCTLSSGPALQNNSLQLRELSWLPSSVAVYAIAGDVTLQTPLFLADVPVNTDSDLVVGKGSALRGSAHFEEGGGQTVISCSGTVPQAIAEIPTSGNLIRCWHVALPNNQFVESDAVSAIEDYINANVHHSNLIASALPQVLGKSSGTTNPLSVKLPVPGPPPAHPKPPMGAYAGTYYRNNPFSGDDYTMQFTLHADGTYSQVVNMYNINGYPEVTQYGSCKFTAYNGYITATYTSVSWKLPNGTTPAGSSKWMSVGHDCAYYYIATPGVLASPGFGGSVYFCTTGVSSAWKQKCGI